MRWGSQLADDPGVISRIRAAGRALDTSDKVVLFVTGLVGFLAVALVAGIFIAIFYAPENTEGLLPLIELVSNAFLMLTGAIVGYIGGQGVERGRRSDPPPPPERTDA